MQRGKKTEDRVDLHAGYYKSVYDKKEKDRERESKV